MAVVIASGIVITAALGLVYGDCNQKLAARRNEVTYITSPGYPGNFTQYVDCFYEVYSTSDNPGLVVHIDVLDVTLSCDDDVTQLYVYDGFSRNPRFLGQICKGGQTTFESPKQTLYLTFRSRTQHGGRSRGFRLRVRTEPKYCHCYTQKTAVLDASSSPAVLTSPFYPYGAEANVKCLWLLKAPEDSRVNATLLHTDMKGSGNCRNFGLYIYDGKTTYDDKLLASVCDNSLQSFQSSGQYLLVEFSSGSRVYRSGGGIKLQYSAIPSEVEERQLVGQTLFFVITALLILLIIIISILAAIKLFVLPRRRKQAERRRRAARARLTRVNRGSNSQAESRSEGARHASCTRASSAISGSSVSSQWSRMSLTRLLSLYGLKKCRQERRCSSSSRSASHNSMCLYNAQRSGVMIQLPDFALYEAGHADWLSGDLPPSYEEAVRQGPLGEVLEQVVLEEVLRESAQEGADVGVVGQSTTMPIDSPTVREAADPTMQEVAAQTSSGERARESAAEHGRSVQEQSMEDSNGGQIMIEQTVVRGSIEPNTSEQVLEQTEQSEDRGPAETVAITSSSPMYVDSDACSAIMISTITVSPQGTCSADSNAGHELTQTESGKGDSSSVTVINASEQVVCISDDKSKSLDDATRPYSNERCSVINSASAESPENITTDDSAV